VDGTKSKRRCSLKSSATLPSGDFISRSLRSNVRLAATLWGCARRASSARQDHRAKIIARPQQAAQRGPKEARKQQSAKVTLGSRTHISRDTLWHKRVSLSLVATRECLCLFCVAVGARAKHKAQSTKHKAQSAKRQICVPNSGQTASAHHKHTQVGPDCYLAQLATQSSQVATQNSAHLPLAHSFRSLTFCPAFFSFSASNTLRQELQELQRLHELQRLQRLQSAQSAPPKAAQEAHKKAPFQPLKVAHFCICLHFCIGRIFALRLCTKMRQK